MLRQLAWLALFAVIVIFALEMRKEEKRRQQPVVIPEQERIYGGKKYDGPLWPSRD